MLPNAGGFSGHLFPQCIFGWAPPSHHNIDRRFPLYDQLCVRNAIPTLTFDYVGVGAGAARDINIFHGVGHIRGFSAITLIGGSHFTISSGCAVRFRPYGLIMWEWGRVRRAT